MRPSTMFTAPWITPPQDLDKAKALLAEAGYPDGYDITLYALDDPTYKQHAEMLKDEAAPAGLNIKSR